MDDSTDWGEDIARETVPMPVFSLDTETNTALIDWPDGKPQAVSMTPEDLEKWVEDRNDNIHALANVSETLEMASNRIAELVGENETMRRANERLQTQVTALTTVTNILRLGRRPNREQWIAAGMLAPHAQLESDRLD